MKTPRLPSPLIAFIFLSSSFCADQVQNIFSRDQAIPITIEIEPAGINTLGQTPREYVPAKVRSGTNKFAEIRIRLKGGGSFRPIEDHPSFSLKLSSPAAQRMFGGREKVLLNNSAQDPSF